MIEPGFADDQPCKPNKAALWMLIFFVLFFFHFWKRTGSSTPPIASGGGGGGGGSASRMSTPSSCFEMPASRSTTPAASVYSTFPRHLHSAARSSSHSSTPSPSVPQVIPFSWTFASFRFYSCPRARVSIFFLLHSCCIMASRFLGWMIIWILLMKVWFHYVKKKERTFGFLLFGFLFAFHPTVGAFRIDSSLFCFGNVRCVIPSIHHRTPSLSLSLSPADSVHRPADGRLDAAAATTSTTTTTTALSAASATSAASSSATAAAAASTLRSAVGVPAVAAAVHRRRSGAHGDDRSPRRARRRRGRFLYRTLFFLYFSFFFFVFINAGMPRSDPAAPKKNAVAPLPIARAVVWLLFYVERSAFSTLFSSSISSKQSQSRFFRVFSLALEKFGSIGFCFSISSNFHLAGHSSDCGAFPRQSFVLFLFFFCVSLVTRFPFRSIDFTEFFLPTAVETATARSEHDIFDDFLIVFFSFVGLASFESFRTGSLSFSSCLVGSTRW